MPLTSKGNKILSSMRSTYGSDKKAKRVFYASINKGKLSGVEGKADGGPAINEDTISAQMARSAAMQRMRSSVMSNARRYAAGGAPKIAAVTPTAPWYQRSALRNMAKSGKLFNVPGVSGLRKQFAGGGMAAAPAPAPASMGVAKGMLGGASPGRVDNRPLSVSSGSYVIPADSVSAIGQGNSAAGAKMLTQMFSGAKMNSYGGHNFRMPGVKGMKRGTYAEGGDAEGEGEHVPIIAASGEYVLTPEEVAWFGDGDMKKGHDALDRFVLSLRKKHIQELKRIKPPKKN